MRTYEIKRKTAETDISLSLCLDGNGQGIIDTGCGLERLSCVMQEVETNYDSDLFMPLINYLSEYTGRDYHTASYKMPYRVIADHIRSVTFAIADGATLSNEGRGYVLRRILRRAVRFGKKLGINEPFLYKMVDIVVNKFNDFYPYLDEKKEIVKKIIKIEEESFLKTLENGEKKLIDIIEATSTDVISGKDAFLLYDTFGFPIELTEELANKILLVGLMENLAVVYAPSEQGEYRIIAGERRWEALKLLVSKGYKEFETVTCQIRTLVDEAEEQIELTRNKRTFKRTKK